MWFRRRHILRNLSVKPYLAQKIKIFFAQSALKCYICAENIWSMKEILIGRETESRKLREYLASERSEFIAVYGRRRVGKTFLVRKVCDDSFAFFVTGMYKASKTEQLINFAVAVQRCFGTDSVKVETGWILAFNELARHLESLPEGNKVVFIDELPWMDRAKSGFIPALENFWNGWASLRNDIKLIVCGSATSWMISNLIHSKGGLHGRLTHQILISPFSLYDCECYFNHFGYRYSRKQIAECYMVMGGIPYYFSLMDKSLSLAQNIDRLFFGSDSELRDEFSALYRALFRKPEPYISVVTALAEVGKGMTRRELVARSGLTDNGAFSAVLEELEQCGFIRSYLPFGMSPSEMEKRLPKDTVFQLVDFFTMFYFSFMKKNRYHDAKFWSSSINSPAYNAWAGLSFEKLCLAHLPQMKQRLGIFGVQTNACSWLSRSSSPKAQIDLLIDRRDETVNLCEMKFSRTEYEIDSDEEQKLQHRIDAFRSETATNKSIIMTLVTASGLKRNSHSDIVQSLITLEDLFASTMML